MTQITCANRYCRRKCEKPAGQVKRACKTGMRIYCSRMCAGYARRAHKTEAEKKEEKRLYDKARRDRLRDRLKAEKAAYFKRTYDPVKAAEARKMRMPAHVEYCRRPEYKSYKRQYDRKYRANRTYGEFAEAFMLLMDIDDAVNERMTDYEVRFANGTLNKTQTRRRMGI